MTDTTGKIYFAIKTEDETLDLDTFKKYLTIEPSKYNPMRSRGNVPVCTIWEYGIYDMINPIYYDEIERLVGVLQKHSSEFIQFKTAYPEIEYVLEIVIYIGDETPGLGFSKQTLHFVSAIDAIIDCDIYNSK